MDGARSKRVSLTGIEAPSVLPSHAALNASLSSRRERLRVLVAMLMEHGGLMVFLLVGTAAHGYLLDAAFGRQASPSALRLLLLIGPLVFAPIGELIAIEARQARWRRLGLGIAAAAAATHLLVDVACLAHVDLLRRQPLWVAGSLLSMIVMGLVLRFALRSLAADAIVTLVDVTSQRASWAQRVERELWLVGGTPVSMLLVSLAFVAMALVGLTRTPGSWPKLLGAALFFVACAAVALRMGWERRRSLGGG
jgi:hypothetical protein